MKKTQTIITSKNIIKTTIDGEYYHNDYYDLEGNLIYSEGGKVVK